MGPYYGKKIINGQPHYKTGLPYTINAVPRLWREEVRQWLKDHYPDRNWDD